MVGDLVEIRDAALRGSSLTRHLLAFSRRQVFQPAVVDLNAVVAGTEKMLRRLVGEDIELETAMSPEGAEVFVDPGQVEQVVMNLVVNARDAMPDGGRLRIAVSRVNRHPTDGREIDLPPGPYVVLTVSDTGIGMDAETRARIFEPFFTTKEVGKGTGLGLSTVFGIVKQCGGSIDVQSEPGRGATFRVWLPLRTGDGGATSLAHDASITSAGQTILLVEDDDALRRAASTILTKAGYRVLEARGGGDAILLCESHTDEIHLVLTDMVMPLMSGEQVVTRIRTMRPEIAALFMSGYPGAGRSGPSVTPDFFVQKPFTPDGLLRQVAHVLARRTPRELRSEI
jgi:CheY-like chemotaxis protein